MLRGRLPVPDAAIEPVAVLGQRCQVNDPGHRTVVGPGVGVVGGGQLAQIVESRPDELSDQPGKILSGGKVVVGRIRPSAILDVIPQRLVVSMQAVRARFDQEVVDAARRDRRGGFGAKQDVLRQTVVS